MRKEIVKGFTMVLLVISLALVTAVASAQGQSANRVVSTIPFDFVVGDKTLPAGEYSVRGMTRGGEAILISERDAKASIIQMSKVLTSNRNNTRARLVFHRYGQHYFLAEVWSGGDQTGRQLFRSRQERAIDRELAAIVSKTELAGRTYETVELLATVR
ncbi:MAG: hypothetical protein ACR2LM_19600 [Pyrinomonadaceae bacterium]